MHSVCSALVRTELLLTVTVCCWGHISLKSVLTSSFKLAGRSVVYLIGQSRHLKSNSWSVSVEVSHLQPRPLSTLTPLWPLWPLALVWKVPRWGCWLGPLSLRYHMWRLCFSPAAVISEACCRLTKSMSYRDWSRVCWFPEARQTWYVLLFD